jgi:glutamate-ammonia-ligase adenylyltransferase
LLRARACAGDLGLGERVIEVAKVAAYERGAPPVEELHRLRLRMQNELAREHGGQYDLKTGRGGLLDIEFCSQWLQMRHGSDPRVRTTDTAEALEALWGAAYLAQDDFQVLRDGYLFLRRLEQRIHVQHGKGQTRIGLGLGGLEQLARRMGFEERGASGQALLAQYEAVTRDVRAAYCQVLGIEE